MRLDRLFFLPLAGLLVVPVAAPSMLHAKGESRVEKKVRELEKKNAANKKKNQVNIPPNWTLGAGANYAWPNPDVDSAFHWEVEAQKRVSTYGVVALGVNAGNHNLSTTAGDMDVVDVNLSYILYVPENNKNRQPSFYYGAGLNLLNTSITGAGSSSDLGLHLRAGVEFRGGLYTEMRYTIGPEKAKYNNARLGHLTLGGGYRFSL